MPKEAHKVAHFCSMCGPNILLDEITQTCADYAAAQGITEDEALTKGMERTRRFNKAGAEIYKIGVTKRRSRRGRRSCEGPASHRMPVGSGALAAIIICSPAPHTDRAPMKPHACDLRRGRISEPIAST